jgi:hypothetical protein
MSRLYAWVAGAASGLAAYRLLTRRHRHAGEAEPELDPRAGELRAKLAEQHEAAEPPEPEPAPEPELELGDPDLRRRGVHERGRATIDEMRGAE